jgi:hypothetical protein
MDPINLHLITRKFVQEQNHVGDKSAVRESCRKLRKIALPQEQLPIVRLPVLFHEHAAALQPVLLHNWHFLLAVMPPSLPTKQPNHAQCSECVSS